MGTDHAGTSTDAPSADGHERFLLLGTAGHIDHGKTSLIRALTGTNTDRLPEEQRRGMTIELGFAELPLGDLTFGVVDVPGHERFVRTMVAGVSGIQVALLVVAADDGVMPQTVEHIEILHLLGVERAVVAVSKCDLVDRDLVALVEAEVAEQLAGTPMVDAAVVPVSATTGAGLDALRDALRAAASTIAEPAADRPFRLAIDRVFAVAGHGTVITGSVLSGEVSAADELTLLPVGRGVRVREVQSHRRGRSTVRAGERAAINLAGLDRDAVRRGDELATPGTVQPARFLDVELTCVASHRSPIDSHARLRLCIGTRELTVRCVLLDAERIEPGETRPAQLRAGEPVVATAGQRFIVRDENAARTAGGGRVLRLNDRRVSHRMAADVAGLAVLAHGTPAERLAEVHRHAGYQLPDDRSAALAAGVRLDELVGLTKALRADGKLIPLGGAKRWVSADFCRAFETRAQRWLRQYHLAHPDEPGCLAETFHGFLERRSDRGTARDVAERLTESGVVRGIGRYLALSEFAPALSPQDEQVLAAMLDAAHAGGFAPPGPADLASQCNASKARIGKLLKLAVASRMLVEVDAAIYLHAEREAELRSTVQRIIAEQGAFTVAVLRETLGTTRKYAVPLAEYLDRAGVTRRVGDKRVLCEQGS